MYVLAGLLKNYEWITVKFSGMVGGCIRNKPLLLEVIRVELRPSTPLKDIMSVVVILTTDHIFMKILPESNLGTREFPLPFWKSPGERSPPPSTSNGAPGQTMIIDHIFVKIVPEMFRGTKESSLHCGNDPQSADLHQRPTTPLLATT